MKCSPMTRISLQLRAEERLLYKSSRMTYNGFISMLSTPHQRLPLDYEGLLMTITSLQKCFQDDICWKCQYLQCFLWCLKHLTTISFLPSVSAVHHIFVTHSIEKANLDVICHCDFPAGSLNSLYVLYILYVTLLCWDCKFKSHNSPLFVQNVQLFICT